MSTSSPARSTRSITLETTLRPTMTSKAMIKATVSQIAGLLVVTFDLGPGEMSLWTDADSGERLANVLMRAARSLTGEALCSVEAHFTGAGRCCLAQWITDDDRPGE